MAVTVLPYHYVNTMTGTKYAGSLMTRMNMRI